VLQEANVRTQPARFVDVVCHGDPWERGYAQGAGLRDKICTARDLLADLEAFRLKQPWWLPYFAFRRAAERKARRFLETALSDSLPEAKQRLEGIAAGSKLPLNTIYLLNALEPVLSSVEDATEIPALGACAAVAVRGSRSATGEPIIARNFDYLPMVQPLYCVRENRPAGKLRSLNFMAAPLCGAIDGLNEDGLCITYNYAFVTDPARPAPPISMLIAEALDRFATVADAAAWITSRPHWGAGLLMLADAGGDIASLELSNSQSRLRRPAEGEDMLFHSNTFACEPMRAVELDKRAVYTDRAPRALRGRCVLQSATLRDRRFLDLLQQSERWGQDELGALMADHGPDGNASADTICMHGDYWYTTACLQFFPRSRRMRVAYASACEAKFTVLGL
jgi:hypothetical protein